MPSRRIDDKQLGEILLTKRKKSKNIRINVDPEGKVKVSMPYFVPFKAAVLYVENKRSWILKNQTSGLPLTDNMIFTTGLKLRLIPIYGSKNFKTIKGINNITIYFPGRYGNSHQLVQKRARQAICDELINRGYRLLNARVERLASKLAYNYQSLKIKKLKSRWGSCDQKGNIVLNLFLLQLPEHLVDYVIIHELVHTEHRNHGRLFWTAISGHLYDYRKLKKELKEHKPVLTPL